MIGVIAPSLRRAGGDVLLHHTIILNMHIVEKVSGGVALNLLLESLQHCETPSAVQMAQSV